MSHPLLIAHRGDHVNFPENTPEAFQSAFAQGADGVEMDVHLVDGELRVFHNYIVENPSQSPLLETILTQCAQQGRLEIEIKEYSTDIITPLADLLERLAPPNIEITTSEIPLLPYLRARLPEVSLGAIFHTSHYEDWMTEELYLQKVLGHMQMLDANVAHIGHYPADKLTPQFVEALHAAGYRVHCHIGLMSRAEQVQRYTAFARAGVDQCTFDDIGLVAAVRPH